MEIREFLERELRPIADDYWDRAEFPMHLIPEVGRARHARAGVAGDRAVREHARCTAAGSRSSSRGSTRRFATFVGVQNGLTMGAIGVGGSPEQRAQWLPPMARGEVIGGFGLTEPLSGSDTARGLRTTAHRTATPGCSTAPSAGSATPRSRTSSSSGPTRRRRRPGQGLPRPPRHARVHRDEDRAQAGAAHRAERRHPARRRRGRRGRPAAEHPLVQGRRHRAAADPRGGRLAGASASPSAPTRRPCATRASASSSASRSRRYQLVQDRLARCLGNITASIALCVRVSQLQDEGRQRDEHSALAKSYATTRHARDRRAVPRDRSAATASSSTTASPGYFADAEAVYSFEGTRDMNNLIVGRAITGIAAFV